MSKRKRGGVVVNKVESSEDDLKREELERQIQLGKRQLTRNLRLAKGFERQKLGRREKDAKAKNDEGEMARIEAEILALKQIDIPTSAEHHLHKTLLKTKRIKESDLLSPTTRLPPRIPVNVATSNVTARMYNANLVKAAMTEILHAIKSIIGIPKEKATGNKGKQPKVAEKPAQKQQIVEKVKANTARKRKPSISSMSEESEDNGDHSEVTLASESGSESDVKNFKIGVGDEEFDSEDYAAFDARIASSSSNEDENEIPNNGKQKLIAKGLSALNEHEHIPAHTETGKHIEKGISLDRRSFPTSTTKVEDTQEQNTGEMDTSTINTKIRAEDASPMERPIKSAVVARRMILSHLGIKQPRKSDSRPTSSGGQTTALEEPSHVPVASSDTGSISPPAGTSVIRGTNFDEIAAESPENGSSNESKLPPPLSSPPKRAREVQTQEDSASSSEDNYPPPKKSKPSKTATETTKEETTRLAKESVAAARAKKSAKSTFLPSLADGGYWSGSESAPSDIEDHIAPRKNRRGQRARQAIWEKKHGKLAKHVVNGTPAAKPKANSRDDGWDAKRGATAQGDGPAWKKGRGERWKGDGGFGGSNAVPVKVVGRDGVRKRGLAKDDEGPLHPSWEAKKIAKSRDGIVAFTGKKITFD
ncbi:Bud-site selection protein [Tothia fuscella]|uniref:Bud-site selection protein n=1 Tax=Tothia fuscella TaxID=1048955 RepID=A0A9P4TTT4_9PEZI|nr:Bud-site selection protein [Tothia fuscella]